MIRLICGSINSFTRPANGVPSINKRQANHHNPMITESHKPITYVIDYSDNHLDDIDSYVSRVAEAPPELLHFAMDTPFLNTWGAMHLRKKKTFLISPAGIRKRIAKIREFTDKLHQAGVKIVIPYICNQTIAGDPEKRRGIWKFYDHWDDYAEFGFGPKPPDPIEWLAREEYGRPHYNYEMRHSAFVQLGEQRYAPCPNNPHYRKYQRGIVENIAKVGYDGVFVDNCVLNCYCIHCQSKFQEYVQNHFTAQEQKEIFGFEDPSDIHLATKGSKLHWVKTEPIFRTFLKQAFPADLLTNWLGTADPEEILVEEGGNGLLWNMADHYLTWMETRYSPEERLEMFGTEDLSLWGILDGKDRALWAETKLFWARSVAENLRFIREVGESIRPNFVILPNWGEMQLTDGNEFREEIGHDLREWQPESDWQMFEESNEPGLITPGIYLDFMLELKFALANGVRGAILSHAGGDPNTAELSFAECLAGLGTFIQPGINFPGIRMKYRDFQDKNIDLLEGWTPYYHVGLAYFYNQLHLENMEHMHQVHKFTRYFADQHVLFHYLTEEDLSPEIRLPCKILVLPELTFMSDEQIAGVENFLSTGGICFSTGPLGISDERARRREESVIDRLSDQFPDRFIHTENIASLIPDDKISLDAARRFARTTWRTLNVPGSQSFEAMMHLDEELGIQRYMDGGNWPEIVREKLDTSLRISSPRHAAGVRFNAYRKDKDIALHIVNYNVDLVPAQGDRTLTPAKNVEVSLPLPESFTLRDAGCMEPGRSDKKLDTEQMENRIRFIIPDLDFYKLIVFRGS